MENHVNQSVLFDPVPTYFSYGSKVCFFAKKILKMPMVMGVGGWGRMRAMMLSFPGFSWNFRCTGEPGTVT